MTQLKKLNEEKKSLQDRLLQIQKNFEKFDLDTVKNLKDHAFNRVTKYSTSDQASRKREGAAVVKFFENLTLPRLMRIKQQIFAKRLFYKGDFVLSRYRGLRYDYYQDLDKFFTTRGSLNQNKIQKSKLEKELKDLEAEGYGGIFSCKLSKSKYENKRNDLLRNIDRLNNHFSTSFIDNEEFLLSLCKTSNEHNEEIRVIDARIKEIQKRILEFKKEDILSLKIAKAAAFDGEARAQAKSQRGKVNRTDDCPYCFGIISGDAHLDHIHPLSKGGLNVTENLVYCCKRCNLKKSDKGIFQFCREQGFDYIEVCDRLLNMGKHV